MGEKDSKSFNQLTPKEWALLSKSVWNDVSSQREWYHREHGATFSKAMASRVIQMYSKEGDLILDPFAGVGTTLLAAKELGRKGIGVEIYEKFVEIIEKLLTQQILNDAHSQMIHHDDCRNLLKYVEPESVQLMLTSPPYANFIQRSVRDRKNTHKKSLFVSENSSVIKQYGEDKNDFGNLDYQKFLDETKDLMKKLFVVTKPGGYNVWVVKDCRDPQNGRPFISFHSDIAKIGEETGFLWHDLIVWDQNAQRRLVLLGYPTVFYVNINHTFLVVLRKPRTVKNCAN